MHAIMYLSPVLFKPALRNQKHFTLQCSGFVQVNQKIEKLPFLN